MSNISMTAAIRATKNTVSISGHGTSWQVTGPHQVTNPKGPYTTLNTTSYGRAQRAATQWRAEVVLAMMGVWTEDVMAAVADAAQDPYANRTLPGLIRTGVAAASA